MVMVGLFEVGVGVSIGFGLCVGWCFGLVVVVDGCGMVCGVGIDMFNWVLICLICCNSVDLVLFVEGSSSCV